MCGAAGGILAGHDYLHSAEVAARPGNTQDWSRELLHALPRADLSWLCWMTCMWQEVRTALELEGSCSACESADTWLGRLPYRTPPPWTPAAVCADGSRHEGAVKGAVDEFAAAHGLSVLVTYNEPAFPTWVARKP